MGQYNFLANVFLLGKISVKTGLSIGGSSEGYEIGGMENPVIRYIEGQDEVPYIPGSSVKGKLRSLLEWSDKDKLDEEGKVHKCDEPACYICRTFGRPAEEKVKQGPARLIIRDAFPDHKTRELMEWIEKEKGLPKTEWKTEVTIDRLTSEAPYGPRDVERVPKGSQFDLRIIYGIYNTSIQEKEDNGETDINNLSFIFKGFRMLQDSWLGGSGSRGYGRISFKFLQNIPIRTAKDYEDQLNKIEILEDNLVSLEELDTEQIEQQIRTELGNVSQ